jgi:uncharacterized membrane protein
MTYNIHPIFVHFPIALLLIYSVIKIVPFQKWFPKVAWKHLEMFLLVMGVLGSFAAIYTGEASEHLISPKNRQLLEMHAFFAVASAWLYGLILFGEVLFFINPIITEKIKLPPRVNNFLLLIQKILTNVWLSKLLAFFGLLAIATTGMLGGVLVYGLSADPLAPIVLKLLGITY